MTWLEALPFRARLRWACLGLVLLISTPSGILFAQGADADPAHKEPGEAQAWLLTYGPGDIYWQRFGHNAIWIRDPALGLDHTFNFGFFDFGQQGFLSNFLLGRLNYFAAARPAQVELAEYIDENRSIRAQRLDLDGAQISRLTDYLLTEVSEGRREYLYDYYRHNCSTRIRDAIDIALDGAVEAALGARLANLNYRDHTRRLTGMDYWLYLGLETGLGSPVDRPISRWEEAFIPGVLANAVDGLKNPRTGRPLVLEDVMLHESTLPSPPAKPGSHWLSYLAVAVLLLAAAFFAVRFSARLEPRHLAIAWLVLAGLIGAVLAFLWCCTDHWVSRLNLNLLLLNPLWLVLAAVPALRRPGAWLVLIAAVLAVAAPWLPPAQYNSDVVALVAPLNLAAALSFIIWRTSASQFRQ